MSPDRNGAIIDPKYLVTLVTAFRDLHGCRAEHADTVPVLEHFQNGTVWEGSIEVFTLAGHPKAVTGYAWAYDNGKGGEIFAVLKVFPIMSPRDAVRAAVASAAPKQNKILASVYRVLMRPKQGSKYAKTVRRFGGNLTCRAEHADPASFLSQELAANEAVIHSIQKVDTDDVDYVLGHASARERFDEEGFVWHPIKTINRVTPND